MTPARHRWPSAAPDRGSLERCLACGCYRRRGLDGFTRYFAAVTVDEYPVQQYPTRPACKPRSYE